MSFGGLGFERAELLVLAPLSAVLLALALGSHGSRLRRLAAGYSSSAFRRLLPAGLGRFPSARLLCLACGGVALGVAAAGPAWVLPESEERPPLDLAIAVDLSLSMSATDAAPNRMARAREVIARLSEELPSVRFSLVVFAGWPYTLLPPTDDPALLRYFAQSLDVTLVPRTDNGTALAEAVELSRYSLEARPSEDSRQIVLLISDGGGEANEAVLENSTWLRDDGFEVWVAALGSDAGTPLFFDGAPFLDEGGEPVVASLNESLLRDVAEAGGGSYVDVTREDGLEALLATLREVSGDRENPPPPVDAAFLLVLLAIPLFLWEALADFGRSRKRAS
ncbi:MAG: VWA domain-containing protein [Longimicrobiales bacterium]